MRLKTIGIFACIGGIFLASMTYAQSKTWKDSEILFTRLTNKYPHFFVGYQSLGRIYLRTDRVDQAIKSFETVIDLHPSGDAFGNLGNAYVEKGYYEKAVGLFKEGLQNDPENPQFIYHGLGDMHGRMGNIPKALQALDRALEIDPEYAEVYTRRGYLLSQAGRTEEALNDYQKALSINPFLSQPRYNIALEYTKFGNTEEAIKQYKDVISRNPLFFKAYINLGVIYQKLDRREEAIDVFEALLKRDPGNAKAQKALQLLL